MILVRHGQSHFNLHFSATRQDPGIVDPGLTAEGVDQARQAGVTLERYDIRRILVSPYSRTLETAERKLGADNGLCRRLRALLQRLGGS